MIKTPTKKVKIESSASSLWNRYGCKLMRPLLRPANLQELAYRTLLDHHVLKGLKEIPITFDLKNQMEKAIHEITGIPLSSIHHLVNSHLIYNGKYLHCAVEERLTHHKVRGAGFAMMRQQTDDASVCIRCANACLKAKVHRWTKVLTLRLHVSEPGLDVDDPDHLFVPILAHFLQHYPPLCLSGLSRSKTHVSDIILHLYQVGLNQGWKEADYIPGVMNGYWNNGVFYRSNHTIGCSLIIAPREEPGGEHDRAYTISMSSVVSAGDPSKTRDFWVVLKTYGCSGEPSDRLDPLVSDVFNSGYKLWVSAAREVAFQFNNILLNAGWNRSGQLVTLRNFIWTCPGGLKNGCDDSFGETLRECVDWRYEDDPKKNSVHRTKGSRESEIMRM